MINIGFIGSISTGKTTLINALIGDFIGNTKLKRTTCEPFQFIKTKKSCEITRSSYLFYNNRWATKINSLYDGLSIIDFPGLFDAKEPFNKMEKLFLSHLNNLNFIFYVLDSNQCLNNKYEKDFISNLITTIKTSDYYIELNIIFNKYDEDDDEVLELINETIITINKEFDYFPNFFILNGRKIMVKEIIIKNGKFDTIPVNIVMKTFNKYFGNSKSKKIINSNYISPKNIVKIKYSTQEISFFKHLSQIMNTKNYYDKCLIKTNKLLECEFNDLNDH
jgi:GTPase SAR1 family protein